MTDYYSGYEIMSAPNRYRKLLPKQPDDADSHKSSALLCFEQAGFGASGEAIRARALAMMQADWPDKARRAIGMEPDITLTDIILIWKAGE